MTYFSFTCTPLEQTLETFGTLGPNGKRTPFSAYPFSRAIEDGVVMDVTKNIISIRKPEWADSSKDGIVDMINLTCQVSPDTIASKARFILEDFLKRSQEMSNATFKAKGMLVVSGRPHIIEYKKEMEAILPKLAKKAGQRVWAFFRLLKLLAF